MGNRYGGEKVIMGGTWMKAVVFGFSQESQDQNSKHRLVQLMKKTSRSPCTVVNNGTNKCTFSTHQLQAQLQVHRQLHRESRTYFFDSSP